MSRKPLKYILLTENSLNGTKVVYLSNERVGDCLTRKVLIEKSIPVKLAYEDGAWQANFENLSFSIPENFIDGNDEALVQLIDSELFDYKLKQTLS